MAAALVAAALASCSDDGGDPEAFCAGVREVTDVSILIGGTPGEQDAATSLRTAADRLRALSGDAPDEVDGDVRRIADALEVLAEAAADPDVGVAGRLRELDREALVDSAANLERYAREECRVDLTSSTSTAPTTSTSAAG